MVAFSITTLVATIPYYRSFRQKHFLDFTLELVINLLKMQQIQQINVFALRICLNGFFFVL